MIVGATIPWQNTDVGCFDPSKVLHRLCEDFGDDLEFDRNDLFEGHYERVVQAAMELGIPSDRPAVRSAARKVLELSRAINSACGWLRDRSSRARSTATRSPSCSAARRSSRSRLAAGLSGSWNA